MKSATRTGIQSSTYYPRFIQPQSRFNIEAGFFMSQKLVYHELHGLTEMNSEEVFDTS